MVGSPWHALLISATQLCLATILKGGGHVVATDAATAAASATIVTYLATKIMPSFITSALVLLVFGMQYRALWSGYVALPRSDELGYGLHVVLNFMPILVFGSMLDWMAQQ